MQYFKKWSECKKKKIHNEQNTRVLNIDRSVMLPSHIEARGKEKISNSDLVNHGFLGGVFILIKKYCTGTLFVLITEFLARPCIGCPRRYLTRLPLVLVLPQPLCRPHLGRLHSVCSGTQARNPGSSVAPLLPFTHLSRPPPSISQDCLLFFPSSLLQWGSLRGLPLADRNSFLDFPASSALHHNTSQCVQQTP